MKIKQLATVDKADDWFDPNALYAAKHMLPKNKKLYYIKMDDFLKMAIPTKTKGGAPHKVKGVEQLVKEKIKFSQIPYLRISHHIEVDDEFKKTKLSDTGLVWGHEGRHRSMILKKLGYKMMPIIVDFQDMKNIPKYVINQTAKDKFKFSDIFKPYR
jgi:hypothetical protein